MAIEVRLVARADDESTWWWRRFAVSIPEATRGAWRVERFTVSEHAAFLHSMGMQASGIEHRSVAAGDYTRLLCNGEIIMSDTPAEIKDHLEFFALMRGRVLITGLGIGMAAEAALRDPDVTHVRVVELDADVIALTGPTLAERYGEKLSIVHGDAFTYHKQCSDSFDVIWHDVWPTISEDNLAEMSRVRRAWAKRASWQGCWAEDECKRSRARWRRRGRR